MVEVIVTDEFSEWYEDLNNSDHKAVLRVVTLLEERGIALGTPHSSAIKGSAIALRELRVQSGGRPLRILYAFDTIRQAVLLVGGDKTGNERFYAEYVPTAERVWAEYLRETNQ